MATTLYDIAFIGSGISSSYTLLRLLEQMEEMPEKGNPIEIIVFDQYDEFIKGIPYGKRSGNSVLLITNLEDFLPEPERSVFVTWLNANKKRMIDLVLEEGGSLSKEWLEKNRHSIDNEDWNKVFVPRSFFGYYLEEKLQAKITRLKEMGRCSVSFVNSEVTDINKIGDSWEVKSGQASPVQTKRAVLAVGSLPTRFLWKTEDIISENGLLFINDLYAKGLNKTLQQVKSVAENSPSPLNVAIIGANASALEVLYRLNDIDDLRDQLDSFYFVSSFGLLPDCVLDLEKLKGFECTHLSKLENKPKLKAREIYDAANLDLDRAQELGIGARTTVGVTSKAIGALLKYLSSSELEEFACHYGNEIGRRQRCGGEHYLSTIDSLTEQGRFEHFAGRFYNMNYNGESQKWSLQFEDTLTKEIKELPNPISIVINCTGSLNMESSHIPELIQNIIMKGYGIPNDSKIGFRVNDKMESAPGLHVVGPLLAGNVIGNNAVWHVEHCGRILWLSGLLSEKLMEQTFKPSMKMHNSK